VATFSLYTERSTLLSPELKKLPLLVFAFAGPVPAITELAFLAMRPAIIAL
jgi:hypothetical protein